MAAPVSIWCCTRVNLISVTPYLSDLTATCISQLKPFQEISDDYADPVLVTLGKSRDIKLQEAYVYVCACCATKAVYLELTSDLNSEAFLSSVHSDCDANFVGSYRQLTEIIIVN
ncbi:hypothetical protein ILUMI_24015 [Ignelater luminosus]|uniref:Uncharacterized protein n=1 Tax=Ignelater luminosus TaxID=2038154 RepID=A0A8K0C7U0_IGNLU|nr:hypothetical protein ILUMI_24015 [Ignelater luminosus]